MAFDHDDWRLVYMPESEVMAARGMCDVLRGRYFAVHPERGLIFYQPEGRRKGELRGASPQCNASESIAVRVIGAQFPWAEIKYFETVMLPVHIQDYAP